MGHPQMDAERSMVCAILLLLWSAILLALSHVSVTIKILSYLGITGLVFFQIQRKQLTYETTLSILSMSMLLFITEPIYLPQTVFLVSGLLVLLTLCLFAPIEVVFLVLVFLFVVTYSVLLVFTVAMHTDPAFTGLFLLLLCIFWLAFLRPPRRNEVYR
jgi:hypothetical protein